MKYLKKEKKNFMFPIICVVCVLAILAVGILIGTKLHPEQSDRMPEQFVEAIPETTKVENNTVNSVVDNVEVPTVEPAPVVDDGNFGIDTPYCELRYPMKWLKYVDFEIQENIDSYIVEFYGIASGKNYHLFDVCFGVADGYSLGSFTVDNNEIVVSVVAYDIPVDADITDEERLELNMMCEDMNVVISNLMGQPGFSEQ